MKIQTLFDLLRASQDLLSAFDGVENLPQLVSRLEKLKRRDPSGLLPAPEELLADLESLRAAVDDGLTDTIETGGTLSDNEELPDGSDSLDGALSAFTELDDPESGGGQDAPGDDAPVAHNVNKETPAP